MASYHPFVLLLLVLVFGNISRTAPTSISCQSSASYEDRKACIGAGLYSLPKNSSRTLNGSSTVTLDTEPFPDIDSLPDTTSVDSSIRNELQIHRSRDNSDLYPTNIPLVHHCPFSNVSRSRTDTDDTSHSLTRRQDAAKADLYPPNWTHCDERDAYFFEFSPENIEESNVTEWYARWTVEVRDVKPQELAEHGEWRMFYRWWLQEHDFRCGYDFSICRNAKTRFEVQSMYPGEENRELARRIYFVTLMYDYLHDHTRLMEDTFTDLHVDLSGHLAELIQDFTQHGNAEGAKKCEVIKTVVQTTINTGINIALQFTGAIPLALMPSGSKTEKLLAPMIKVKDRKSKEYQNWQPFNLYAQTNMFVTGLAYQWQTYEQWIAAKFTKDDPMVKTGMGHGWSGMCGSLEGDFQDQSATNEANLVTGLSENFQHTREAIFDTFHAVYTGSIIAQPGFPSLMAAIMARRTWAGENSVVSEIEDSRVISHSIRTVTLKQLVSRLLSESQNWMKCTHDAHAPAMCSAARQARNLGPKGKITERSHYCPHPDTDPSFICEVGSWYFAEDHQHQRSMVALDTLRGFWKNEFNFTLETFMQEVYSSYEKCGNNCTQFRLDEMAFDSEAVSSQEFVLPVCVNDYNKVGDFLRKEKGSRRREKWNFPFICGNFASNETEAFMKAANMGPDSEVARAKSIQQLWRDRIPREMEVLSPFAYYMALCKHSIRFPDKWRWVTNHDFAHNMKNAFNHFLIPYQHKPCKECGWVEENTRGMDEMTANHFFCESRYVWDNILTQQASHVDLMVIPTKRLDNVLTRCKKWMKKHGGKPPYKTKALWKTDWSDAFMVAGTDLLVPFDAIGEKVEAD